MILTCPECSTRYSTSAGAIGPNGRTVRCANCSATWFVAADPEVLQLADSAQAETFTNASAPSKPSFSAALDNPADAMAPAGSAAAAAIRDRADRERSRRRLMGVSMIWVVTLAILAAMAIAGYLLRNQVVERFPAAATLYDAVGVEVRSGGVTFEAVETRAALIDGTPTLVINGRLKNLDGDTRSLTPVRFSLHNSGGQPVAEWIMDPPAASLSGKASAEFLTQYPNPPIDANLLKYRFDDGAPLTTPVAQPSDANVADPPEMISAGGSGDLGGSPN